MVPKVALILCAALLLHACDCSTVTQSATSPDGRWTAEVHRFNGCGGATVRYYTDIKVRERSAIWPRSHNPVTLRGAKDVTLRWRGARVLVAEVNLRPAEELSIRHWKKRVDGLEIALQSRTSTSDRPD